MRDKVLETERLALRKMDISDVDDLMGIFSDPVAMRYYPGTKSRKEAEKTSPPAVSPKRQSSRWRKRSGNGTRRCASTQ